MTPPAPRPATAAPGRRGRSVPRRVTPQRLYNQALFHLQRFASSSANLRRVLMRRAVRSARHYGTPLPEAETMVDEVIARLQAAGLLNDPLYAEGKARGLADAGRSPRMIRARLVQKGVARPDVDRALEGLIEEADDPELRSAAILARKRTLGPFRPEAERRDSRQRDLAVLARAGYGYDVAKRVIDAGSVEELREELGASVF